MYNKTAIEKKIKKFRKELHMLVINKGDLNDEEVIEKSQELDKLLNQYFNN